MPSSTESDERSPIATPLPPDYAPKLTRHAKQLIERIRRDNTDESAVLELKAYYEEQADLPSLANLLEGWGAVLADPTRAAHAFMEASEAVLAGLADLPRARYLCERALARDPSHAGALNRLCTLLETDHDYIHLEQRLRFLVSALRSTPHDPSYLAQVLYRHGQVHHRHLAQPSAARRAYREALELNPGFVPAIVAARQLYLESESYTAAAVLFEMQVAATAGAEDRALLWAELAALRAGPLGDLDGAIQAYRRALREQPNATTTLDELAAVLLRRAAAGTSDAQSTDRARAAHVLFQSALIVPRAEAHARLQRCLAIEPEHARALAMLRELDGYGSSAPERPSASDRPGLTQAAIDAQRTARIDPEVIERAAQLAAPVVRGSNLAETWLSTGELDPVAPSDTGRLGPITEPPPALKAPERTGAAADLAARLQRAREQAAARRSWLPPAPAVPIEAIAFSTEHAHASVVAESQPSTTVVDRPPPSPTTAQVAEPTEAQGGATLVDALVEELDRMPVEVNLGATTEGNLFVGFDNRVQAGGVFVPTFAPLSEGTGVLLQLTLPGGYMTLAHGRVRFVRDAFDFTSELTPGMGVAFEALTPEALALCERFADKRAPMFYDD